MEINQESINVAKIVKSGNHFKLLHCRREPFPENIIKPSFNKKNILDPKLFINTVKKIMADDIGGNISIGLSVPNETIKLIIQEIDTPLRSKDKIEPALIRNIENSYHFSLKKIKISYDEIKNSLPDKKKFIVALGKRKITGEFEKELKKLKINVKVVRTAGVNQLNLYKDFFPQDSTFAYLGIFKYFLTFFVFENAQPVFYQGIKLKHGLSDLQEALYETIEPHLDLVISYFHRQNTSSHIQQLYIGSDIKDLSRDNKFKTALASLMNMDVEIPDNRSVTFNKNENFSHYLPALGAAHSLII